MKANLLEWKQFHLRGPSPFGDECEWLRNWLHFFYENYENCSQNNLNVRDIVTSIVRRMDLPVPDALFDLLHFAETRGPGISYGDWQRDHVLHSLNLFSLGALLMAVHKPTRDFFGTGPLKDKLRKLAFCALLHDAEPVNEFETVAVRI